MTKLERRFLEWLGNGGEERIKEALARARRTSEEFARATTPKWWTLYWPIHAALAAGSRRAKTPQAVECEASQSGGESRNAQSTPLEKNEEKRRGV